MTNKERTIETPVVTIVSTQVGKIALNWLNCRMRLFKDPEFNHIEWRSGKKLSAFCPPPNVSEELFRLDFPMSYDPIVDPATEKWWINMQGANLDKELENL